METQFWSKVKEFHGVELLRNPETFECRILPVEKPQPQQTPETIYSQAAIEATERAVKLRQLMADARITTSPRVIEPKTPEERWRHDPALRAEFNNNLASYLAYCKAAEAGKVKVYGQGTSTR